MGDSHQRQKLLLALMLTCSSSPDRHQNACGGRTPCWCAQERSSISEETLQVHGIKRYVPFPRSGPQVSGLYLSERQIPYVSSYTHVETSFTCHFAYTSQMDKTKLLRPPTTRFSASSLLIATLGKFTNDVFRKALFQNYMTSKTYQVDGARS
jgi:hypothetical protein